MTDDLDVGALLSGWLNARGIKGSSRRWRTGAGEVVWIVELDRIPHGKRVGVDVGMWLTAIAEGDVSRAGACPVVIHLENMALDSEVDRSLVIKALDLESELSADERVGTLEETVEALADYVENHRTLLDVIAAYKTGDFESAFIRRDARDLLESGKA
jgi:hypothetical protein